MDAKITAKSCIKSFVDNPEAAIQDHWGSLEYCPVRSRIQTLATEIRQIKAATKDTKRQKGALASQFKAFKDCPQELTNLKSRMVEISRNLDRQEKRRKELEKKLIALFAPALNPNRNSPGHDFPERFNHPSGRTQKPVPSRVELLSNQEAAWDRYVENHPNASLYHLSAWKRVVEESFGHRCPYLVAKTPEGRITGVLPLVEIKSRLFGQYAVSLPFFNYGGVLADDAEATGTLLAAARAEAARNGWQHIEYRTCQEGWSLPASSRKVSMILKLPSSNGALDESLGAKVRSQVRRTERYQPGVSFGGRELLGDFYEVFARNMRDLGTPVYSKTFFETILDRVPDRSTLVSVRLNDKPVASAFLIGHKNMLEIPWASALREYNEQNVNMWMYRQVLGYAIGRGYDYFDFGRSTRGAGTYHFKKQWGARPLQHHWYYYTPSADKSTKPHLPALNPQNPKYRLAVSAWKRLPLFVANTLGPHIVRNLP